MLVKKTESQLKSIEDELVNGVLAYNDINVKKIILYGSYARGDSDEESDIDIMVLCDNDPDELRKFEHNISVHMASELSLKHDVCVSLYLKDSKTFEKWVNVLPYYRNINNEGVVIYG